LFQNPPPLGEILTPPPPTLGEISNFYRGGNLKVNLGRICLLLREKYVGMGKFNPKFPP